MEVAVPAFAVLIDFAFFLLEIVALVDLLCLACLTVLFELFACFLEVEEEPAFLSFPWLDRVTADAFFADASVFLTDLFECPLAFDVSFRDFNVDLPDELLTILPDRLFEATLLFLPFFDAAAYLLPFFFDEIFDPDDFLLFFELFIQLGSELKEGLLPFVFGWMEDGLYSSFIILFHWSCNSRTLSLLTLESSC